MVLITLVVAPRPVSTLSIPCLFSITKEDVSCTVLSQPNGGVAVGGFASSEFLSGNAVHYFLKEDDACSVDGGRRFRSHL